jgi:long-subunit fatty acid transport protein
MKLIGYGALALAATSTSALALGLDRSGQDITSIFEPGGYVELSYGFTQPNLTGEDTLGNAIANVGEDYSQVALAFKMDLNDSISLGLIIDQPYGVDVVYGGDPTTTRLGGTAAELSTRGITAIGRYRFNDSFSVHAGFRQVSLNGEVTLAGQAYSILSGYNVQMNDGEGTGWLAGVAYERPDIALRVALTYNSEIENEFDTVETSIFGVTESTTTVSAPEAWNLDFQSGIAQDTLLFGSIRYAYYSQTVLSPDFFNGITGGASITDIEDGAAYSLGVARRFTDAFAGSLAIAYEPESSDELVSPLAPTNGLWGITLGGRYTMNNIEFAGGVRYTMLGDALPEVGTPDVQQGTFTDNDAVSVGLSVAYRF